MTREVTLSAAELATLRMLANGLTYRAMARRDVVGEDAIRIRCQRIYRKLGAERAAHAVHLAHTFGLLDDDMAVAS